MPATARPKKVRHRIAQAPTLLAEDALKDRETPKLKKRLIASVGFLAVLMYISMGHMMWGWPLPNFLKDNHVAMGLIQLLLTVIIMVINQKFFISGFQGPHRTAHRIWIRWWRSARRRVVRVQHLRAVRHDRRPGARRYGRCHGLHARVLLRVRRHDFNAHHGR